MRRFPFQSAANTTEHAGHAFQSLANSKEFEGYLFVSKGCKQQGIGKTCVSLGASAFDAAKSIQNDHFAVKGSYTKSEAWMFDTGHLYI